MFEIFINLQTFLTNNCKLLNNVSEYDHQYVKGLVKKCVVKTNND